MRTRVESRARARALQALYAWDMRGEQALDRVASQVWDDLSVAPEERKLAGVLIRKVMSDGPAIDEQLRDVTTNWRLERLGAIERSVLPTVTLRSRFGCTRRTSDSSVGNT